MQKASEDFVVKLTETARRTIGEGYYSISARPRRTRRSLIRAITKSRKTPVVGEVKFVSPAEGVLRLERDPANLARAYEEAGAVAVSVITEPRHFDGRLEYLVDVTQSVHIPVVMKDIVIDPVQVDAAWLCGADAILLIANIFARRLVDRRLSEMIQHAHSRGLEVIVEAHDDREYEIALASEADLVGINNRNLSTLSVSLETSRRLLGGHPHSKLVLCESGFQSRAEISELISYGADAFLVGSALVKSANPGRVIENLIGE